MPTYVYACKNCDHRFEQYQSFSEDSLSTCPECTVDALRKVFDSVGIVFKGPGFYSTDSQQSGNRSSSGTSQTGTESSSADAGSATADSSSGSSSDSGTSSGGSGDSSSSSSGSGDTSTPAAAPAAAAS